MQDAHAELRQSALCVGASRSMVASERSRASQPLAVGDRPETEQVLVAAAFDGVPGCAGRMLPRRSSSPRTRAAAALQALGR